MKRAFWFCVLAGLCLSSSFAQQSSTASAAKAAVPTLVNFSGTLTDLNGKPLAGTVGVTSIYIRTSKVELPSGSRPRMSSPIAAATTASCSVPPTAPDSPLTSSSPAKPAGSASSPRDKKNLPASCSSAFPTPSKPVTPKPSPDFPLPPSFSRRPRPLPPRAHPVIPLRQTRHLPPPPSQPPAAS